MKISSKFSMRTADERIWSTAFSRSRAVVYIPGDILRFVLTMYDDACTLFNISNKCGAECTHHISDILLRICNSEEGYDIITGRELARLKEGN